MLSRIKKAIARLLLLLSLLSLKYVNLEENKEILLLKIPTDPRYCERWTGISKERDLVHSWVDIKYIINNVKYTINNINETNLNV